MSQKILVVGPAWIGDMIMAQCLFKLLKTQHSAVQIDVLAPLWTVALLHRMPEVDQAIPLHINHGEVQLRERLRVGKAFREHQYDQAIVLPNSFKSALIPWFANIPKRTGWLRELRFLLLNDPRRLDKVSYPLMIEQFMALALPAQEKLTKPYCYPSLTVHLDQRNALMKRFHLRTDKPVIAICAGAEYGPSKRWLPEYYAVVANQKLNEGAQVYLFGSKHDQPINAQIMQLTDHRCINLSGVITLDEAIDLLSLASIVLTNDSGLMHIACALDKQVIAFYGSTSSKFTPPLSDKAKIIKLDLPCQPCFKRTCPLKHHHCMRLLVPEQVLQILSSEAMNARTTH